MDSHLKTAHIAGVNTALQECGYPSVAAVEKEAEELGLASQKTAAPAHTPNPLDALRAKLVTRR